MATATRATAPQLAHLAAAAAGELVANWHDPALPIRRWVRHGAKVSPVVCERLLDTEQIRLEPQPGRAVGYTAELTEAGRAVLAAGGAK